MKISLFLVALLLALDTAAQDDNLKVYAENESGGYIVLTHEKCQLESYQELFPYRGYATTNNPNVIYEGCYTIPDISDAPKLPGYTAIPIVTFVDTDGYKAEWPADIFSARPETKATL